MQAGVVTGPIERSTAPKPTSGASVPTPPVHDLNVPYEGTEEYETPTAEILFPPTPLQTPIQTPLPGMGDNSMYNIPTGPTEYPAALDGGGVTDMKSRRPPSFMPPLSPWMQQRPPLSVDVNVAARGGADQVKPGC